MIGQVPVANAVEIVVVGILSHPSVEERPSENILKMRRSVERARKSAIQTNHGILLVLDSLDSNLGHEVIMEQVCRQMGLNRQAFSQELLVEVLSSLLAQQNAATGFVFARAACSTEHLQNVGNRIIHITMFTTFVELNPQDDDHIRSNREAPRSILEGKN